MRREQGAKQGGYPRACWLSQMSASSVLHEVNGHSCVCLRLQVSPLWFLLLRIMEWRESARQWAGQLVKAPDHAGLLGSSDRVRGVKQDVGRWASTTCPGSRVAECLGHSTPPCHAVYRVAGSAELASKAVLAICTAAATGSESWDAVNLDSRVSAYPGLRVAGSAHSSQVSCA